MSDSGGGGSGGSGSGGSGSGGSGSGGVAGAGGVLPVLNAKRAEVAAELEQLTQPAPDAGGISFGKRVGDGTSIAVERITQVAAHDRLQALFAEIDRAAVKVAEESYGRCDTCDRPIAAARLEARPWSTHCVDCA